MMSRRVVLPFVGFAQIAVVWAVQLRVLTEPQELSTDQTSHELGSGYVPRASYNPTKEEQEQQEADYRQKPNKGFIVTDPDRGQLRQPTSEEAKSAIQRSIDYHRKNKRTQDAVTDGAADGVNASTPENEETLALWTNASTPDTISGRARYKLRLQQDVDIQKWKAKVKSKPPVGYAPPSVDNQNLPSSEPVIVKALTGRDEETRLTPVTHMPPWAGCISGPTYEQFFHNDLKNALREHEVKSTNLTGQECVQKCDSAKADCLGYLRHDKGTLEVAHDCWIIPGSAFPHGVNSSLLQDWGQGSIWLKEMSTADDVKNCSGYKEPPNVLPQSDFGTKVEAPEPNHAEISQIKKKAADFFATEVHAMNNHQDIDMVDMTRNQSVAYRLQQESVFVKERLSKVTESKTKTIVKEQERDKKKHIAEALEARTQKERVAKSDELKKERAAKSSHEAAVKATQVKERNQKATPEGQIIEAELTQKKEKAAELEDEKRAAATKEYELYTAEAHKAELERLASLNANISIALNATETGNATIEQIRLLDREGIPYRDTEVAERSRVANDEDVTNLWM